MLRLILMVFWADLGVSGSRPVAFFFCKERSNVCSSITQNGEFID